MKIQNNFYIESSVMTKRFLFFFKNKYLLKINKSKEEKEH